MFVTGPDVIKTVTHEDVTKEDARRCDDAQREAAASRISPSKTTASAWRSSASCCRSCPTTTSTIRRASRTAIPIDREDDVAGRLIPPSPNQPYDMLDLIHAIADEGYFLEVHEHYAKNIVVGFARLGGRPVGIVANQPAHLAGTLDINASVKGARFVRFCDAFNIPLITFEDVPGFLPGTVQEYGGIIRHGAKLLYAFAEATVPKITVITRKAYGGAYCVMASKHIRTDFNYAWPSAEIAVMGPEGAVNILYKREIEQRAGPGGAARAEGRRVPREVRQSLRGGRARLHRRSDPAARYAPQADPGARHAGPQARQEPAEEAREYPALGLAGCARSEWRFASLTRVGPFPRSQATEAVRAAHVERPSARSAPFRAAKRRGHDRRAAYN